jgi:hypothetical protein
LEQTLTLSDQSAPLRLLRIPNTPIATKKNSF